MFARKGCIIAYNLRHVCLSACSRVKTQSPKEALLLLILLSLLKFVDTFQFLLPTENNKGAGLAQAV
jgi:hypothetical protein